MKALAALAATALGLTLLTGCSGQQGCPQGAGDGIQLVSVVEKGGGGGGGGHASGGGAKGGTSGGSKGGAPGSGYVSHSTPSYVPAYTRPNPMPYYPWFHGGTGYSTTQVQCH